MQFHSIIATTSNHGRIFMQKKARNTNKNETFIIKNILIKTSMGNSFLQKRLFYVKRSKIPFIISPAYIF